MDYQNQENFIHFVSNSRIVLFDPNSLKYSSQLLNHLLIIQTFFDIKIPIYKIVTQIKLEVTMIANK